MISRIIARVAALLAMGSLAVPALAQTDVIARGLAVQAKASLRDTQSRLQWWARGWSGVRDAYPVMSSPPTITISGSTSSLNSRSAGNELVRWNSSILTHVGSTVISDGASPTRGVGSHITFADGSTGAGTAPIRTRFIVYDTAFGAMFRGTGGAYVNAIIDGKYACKSASCNPVIPNDGNPHEIKFDFGANTRTLYLIQAAKVAGGSGYTIGDLLTLSGGTCTTQPVVQVTSVSSGAVTGVQPKVPGVCSALSGTLSTTGGTGTGATVQVQVIGAAHTTLAPHTVELIWHGAGQKFYGINVSPTGVVLPWPAATRQPRLCAFGDSQQATYLDYGGAQMGLGIAQRLGMADAYAGEHIGGTGWEVVNASVSPNGPAWSDAKRVADLIAMKCDAIVTVGSQNDAATGTLSATVTSTLNQLLDSNPSLLIVGIGPVCCSTQSVSTTIGAGFTAAKDQARVRYIDNVSEGWVTGSGTVAAPTGNGNRDNILASDNAHLTDAGQRLFEYRAATAVGDMLVTMIKP